jgi:hypothetical protein
MGLKDMMSKMFAKKEPEIYNPQREYIDRRHDALLRQMSFYEKKRQIPIMEAKIHNYEKTVYGNTLHVDDAHNILKTPNNFKQKNNFRWKNGGMLR